MNQNTSQRAFSAKKVLLSVFLSFAALCALILLSAFILQNVSHHERFYKAFSWLISVLLSFWIACISRKALGNSVVFSALVSALFSLVCIAIGCFFATKEFNIVSILIRFSVLTLFSVGATILLNYFSAKKVKTGKWKKPYISKR